MEVSQENYDQELPGILSAIKNADFLTFDCEFSGLGRGGAAIFPYETPELLYSKFKSNVGDFLIVQFGLCCFQYLPEEKIYEYKSYSIYVFPRLPRRFRGLRNLLQHQLTCSVQTDCLEFLSDQSFDFNKWAKSGVGYLRESDLEILKREVRQRHDWRSANSKSPQAPNIPDSLKPKINQILKQVQRYIESEESSDAKTKPLTLSSLSTFERKLVYQSLEHKYGSQLFVETETGSSSFQNLAEATLVVRKCLTTDQHENLKGRRLQEELEELERAGGFCGVIKAIGQSEKTLIGHNVALDLLHTLKAYCSPLPDSWSECRAILKRYFPTVLDTKILANQAPLKNLFGRGDSLQDLISRTKKHPFKRVTVRPSDSNYGYEGSEAKLHDAGYDAFVTGTVFLEMCAYYGDYKNPGRNTLGVPWDLLFPYTNKLPCGRVQDMSSLNLAGEDAIPDRCHVFWVESSSEKWTNQDLVDLFSPYGQIHINWAGRQGVFVALHKRDRAPDAIKNLVAAQITCPKSGLSLKVRCAAEYLKELEDKLVSRAGGGEEAKFKSPPNPRPQTLGIAPKRRTDEEASSPMKSLRLEAALKKV